MAMLSHFGNADSSLAAAFGGEGARGQIYGMTPEPAPRKFFDSASIFSAGWLQSLRTDRSLYLALHSDLGVIFRAG